LRFPSLLFSLLGVAGAMAIGYQLGGRQTGLLSGFLMAISPTDIRYAQEIGPYALMVSLVFWNYFFLIKISLSTDLEWRLLFAWLGLVLFATYTHYIAALGVLIPFGVYTLAEVFSKQWKKLSRNLVIFFLYGVGSMPLFIYYLPYQLSQAVEKNSLKMGLTPSWSLFIDLGKLVVHKVSFLFTGWPFTHIPEWIPFGIVVLLLLENLITLNQSSRVNRIWLIWMAGLFALYSLYSRMDSDLGNFRHGLFFLGMVVPFVASRLSVFLESNWKKWPAVALLLVLVGISLISSPQRSLRNLIYPNESWPWPETNYNLRPAFTHWLDNHQTGEPIYIYFGGNLVFRYYLRLFGVDRCQLERPGFPCPSDDVIYGEWFGNLPDQAKINSVKHSLPDQVNSFWLLLMSVHSNDDNLVLKALQSDYRIVDQSISRGVQLYYFERRRGTY